MAPVTSFSQNPAAWGRSLLLLTVLCAVFLMPVASAYGYSEDYEGYLGETIALHGVSYSGDTIYLFMTGPGLPANGAPLTDPTQRADQGYNTMVGLASDQTWSFKWDTSKIDNQIDPGTYIVYAVNAQADASSLAGHSYQTLSVYLKDSALSKDRVSTGAKYTLNLLDDDYYPVIGKDTEPGFENRFLGFHGPFLIDIPAQDEIMVHFSDAPDKAADLDTLHAGIGDDLY